MEKARDLIIEIGVEELPHATAKAAIDDFRDRFIGCLDTERIRHGTVKEFSTPRRLALLINEVAEQQETFAQERRGPSVEKAFDKDKKPTKALLGFLKGNDVSIKDIVTKKSGSAEYVFCVQEVGGKRSIELLPWILDQTLKGMCFPKTMRWEESGFSFARPVRWALFLYGSETVPFHIADIDSGSFTFGHRVYAPRKIPISNPSEYEKKLESVCVIADREKRKGIIEKQIGEIIAPKGLEVPRIAHELFEVNTDLTEFPHAVLCSFDRSFLDLPTEVLESEMIEHQRYFPLVDKEDRSITNSFIVVSNIKDNKDTIPGFRRVLLARLEDGRFFFEEDKKREFGLYLEHLRAVTFHEQLGSMYDKVVRTGKIADELAGLLSLDDRKKASIAETCRLCKNDLVTLMVNEFPNLQGIIGSYYARASGYDEAVARGVREHYLPRFAQDELPTGFEGAVAGIADRLDAILGIFSIGQRPTGSKDPFALRRKVLAIIRIIIEHRFNFSMEDLIKKAAPLYGDAGSYEALVCEVSEFFKARTRTVFSDMGFTYDEIDASIEGVLDDIYEAYRRVHALHRMRPNPGFEDLLVSFKRMSNIVREQKGSAFDKTLLAEKEEKELHSHFEATKEAIEKSITSKNYEEVYRILSGFKPYVDTFFDQVLVMDENLTIRRNRIGLLKAITGTFSGLVDFSRIVSKGE
jgi:glycyl-tRNA synthetase beta chain